MRDIVGLIGITVYWFMLAIILTSINNDTTLNDLSISFEGNTSTQFNLSTINITDTTISYTNLGDISALSMFGRMLTFRIPESPAFPSIVISIIEITNFILVALFVLLLYRQIRSGSG